MTYLILADVHANLPALEAVLEAESEWDEMIFLGDAVDWGPHPNAVVERLSDLPGISLVGNHDRKMLSDPAGTPPDGRKNFTQWTRSELTASNLETIRGYGESRRVTSADRAIRLHHGDFEGRNGDPSVGRLTARTDLDSFGAVAAAFEESTVLFGHSHQQFHLSVDGTQFVNPGSVGRCNRRGINAQYATLSDGRIELHEVYYDATAEIEGLESLPIDVGTTIWNVCLRRELYRVYRERGRIPTREDVAEASRYEIAHFETQFGSWADALDENGFPRPDGAAD